MATGGGRRTLRHFFFFFDTSCIVCIGKGAFIQCIWLYIRTKIITREESFSGMCGGEW